jgi:hypothetical protein
MINLHWKRNETKRHVGCVCVCVCVWVWRACGGRTGSVREIRRRRKNENKNLHDNDF